MSNPNNVVNPGCVNVADQGDGRTVVDQPVTVSPSSSAGSANVAIASGGGGGGSQTNTNPNTVDVADQAFGVGLPINVKIP